MRLEMLSDHWLTNAWSQKERHLATESGIVRRLLLKRERVPSPGGVRGKRPCTNPQGGRLRNATHRVPNATNSSRH